MEGTGIIFVFHFVEKGLSSALGKTGLSYFGTGQNNVLLQLLAKFTSVIHNRVLFHIDIIRIFSFLQRF